MDGPMKPRPLRAGVIGATGMVGQNYLRLLRGHPWFDVTHVSASPRSAGSIYAEAVAGRWVMEEGIPDQVADLIVADAQDVDQARARCDFVFSAVGMDKQAVRELENRYASAGLPVISNNSAHRHTPDVPMLIPEINPHHADIIPFQRQSRGWDRGFIAVKPNCSLQSYLPPVYALMAAGYPVAAIVVTTLQAVSGAGYPGVPSLDILANIVPYIGGEEEKLESETLKMLGVLGEGGIAEASIAVSAQCNRVPVRDGHLECLSMALGRSGQEHNPGVDEIVATLEAFRGPPEVTELPSSPVQPILVRREPDRPQPFLDREAGNGTAVSVGRIRPCPVLDWKFVLLGHNTLRGAAGGSIHNAELLVKQGWIA